MLYIPLAFRRAVALAFALRATACGAVGSVSQGLVYFLRQHLVQTSEAVH